ncbi:DUF6303 family protein [Streptomyces sp. DSM 44915]|uniref:DUF6303 family protein n=1 Tax=Streptomyces chisholmiae TaxID=3075540 RepID=A0ABU2JKR7_9ACTN|nr:DUF6303 family protein [Streptomyces sp. DSM 44915]MDT0265565.1 DUF6303 family protein [Streptomyces sp. DSM 44915]
MSNAPAYTALLAFRSCGTLRPAPFWNLTVAVCPGRVSEWPSHAWPADTEIPSLADREHALAALGFTITRGEEWRWTEDVCTYHGDQLTHVTLLAAVTVQPLGGGAG